MLAFLPRKLFSSYVGLRVLYIKLAYNTTKWCLWSYNSSLKSFEDNFVSHGVSCLGFTLVLLSFPCFSVDSQCLFAGFVFHRTPQCCQISSWSAPQCHEVFIILCHSCLRSEALNYCCGSVSCYSKPTCSLTLFSNPVDVIKVFCLSSHLPEDQVILLVFSFICVFLCLTPSQPSYKIHSLTS